MKRFKRLRKKMEVLFGLCLLALAVLLPLQWDSGGFQGGVSDQSIGYGGCASCHANLGNGTIEMWASKLDLLVEESVTVVVNVTENVLSANKIIGAFLLNALTGGEEDRPSADGWRIMQDPNGGTNNYVEKVSPGIGSKVSFNWTLRAPPTSGIFHLYARIHHGGGNSYYQQDATGLTFRVSPIAVFRPDLILRDVFTSEDGIIGKPVIIYGTVENNYSDDLKDVAVQILINGTVFSEQSNLTFPAKKVRNVSFEWIPQYEGNYSIEVRIDPYGQINETNEENNVLSTRIIVSKAPVERLAGFEALLLFSALAIAFLIKGSRKRRGEDGPQIG